MGFEFELFGQISGESTVVGPFQFKKEKNGGIP